MIHFSFRVTRPNWVCLFHCKWKLSCQNFNCISGMLLARGVMHTPAPPPRWLDVAHTTFCHSAHTKTHRPSIRLRRLFILTHYSDSECLQTNSSLLPAAFLAWPAELQTLPFPQQTRWKRREIQYNLGRANHTQILLNNKQFYWAKMPNMPKVIFCMMKYFLLASFQKVRRAGNGTNSSARCALFGYVARLLQ